MQLRKRTIQKLTEIINGDNTTHYKSGPKLVDFFNALGSNDYYGQDFPSRQYYTNSKLEKINGTEQISKCIKRAFAVEDYIENIRELDLAIADFNKYLAFDKFKVIRDNDKIIIKPLNSIVIEPQKALFDTSIDHTLNANIEKLDLDEEMEMVIKRRIHEIANCINSNAPLASIFLIGSILEGVLLETAKTLPCQFNQTQSAPKDKSGKVKEFQAWTLNDMINAAAEAGIIELDTKEFSSLVRDFRNYIHPQHQVRAKFSPDKNTAITCASVLNTAICQISDYKATHHQ